MIRPGSRVLPVAGCAVAEVARAPGSGPTLDALLERRCREVGALHEAWDERARSHELLTSAGVAAGSLLERLAEVLGELHEARALLAAVARAQTTPTPAASGRLEEPTHGQATR